MDLQAIGSSTSAVTSVGGTMPTTMTSPAPTPALHGTLDGIAQMLGMSTDDLRGALKQGSSVTDLAQQKGVSRDDLVKSVEAQIQQSRQADGQAPVDQSTLDRMVNRAFDRHGHHHHHHHRVAGADASDPASAAQAGTPGTSDTTPPADGAGGVSVLA